jgi:hypothetical protein
MKVARRKPTPCRPSRSSGFSVSIVVSSPFFEATYAPPTINVGTAKAYMKTVFMRQDQTLLEPRKIP